MLCSFPVPLGLLDFLQVRADFRLPLWGTQKCPQHDTWRVLLRACPNEIIIGKNLNYFEILIFWHFYDETRRFVATSSRRQNFRWLRVFRVV